MKKYLVFGAVAVGGYLVYRMIQSGQLKSPVSLSPFSAKPAPNLMGQPQAQYPFRIQPQTRADNSNQPWYQANRDFIQPTKAQAPLSGIGEAADFSKNVATLTKSVSSIWEDLSGIWGSSDEAPDTEQSNVQTTGGIDWSSLGFGGGDEKLSVIA